MWTLPDQESNPCPLRWQADSHPLGHQGSPLTDPLSGWFAVFVLHPLAHPCVPALTGAVRQQDLASARAAAQEARGAVEAPVRVCRETGCLRKPAALPSLGQTVGGESPNHWDQVRMVLFF